MPQKKVTLKTRKPRDGEIRHYVNTRLGDLADQLRDAIASANRRIDTLASVGDDIQEGIVNERKMMEEYIERAISNCTDAFKTAIATAQLGKVRIVNENCTAGLYAEIGARPPEPVFVPDTPYVLISIHQGTTEVGRMVGKVDVDVFDWDIVTDAINKNDGYILTEGEIKYLKEEDEDLYNKYMAQKYEASMGPAIVRAKLVENWLEEPNSAVLKALQQRGWVIKPYDKE